MDHQKLWIRWRRIKALQEQQDQSADWSSSANVVSRLGLYSNPGRPRAPEVPAGAPRQPDAYQPSPGNGGNSRPYGGHGNTAPHGGQPTSGQTGGRRNYGGSDDGNCRGNLETVAMGWLNEGDRWCATMGPTRDCANRDTSVYPGSGPSTPEVKPLLPACFVLSRQWLQRFSSCSV
jgi:hypothetical protein